MRMPHEPTERLDPPPPGAAERARTVVDPISRRTWSVRAADSSRVPGARSAECLIFDSRDLVRRVWSVPADWLGLPDGVLLDLVNRRPHTDDG